MNKTAKAIICILCVICLALGGLLIWSRVDLSNYKLYKNIISQNEVEQTFKLTVPAAEQAPPFTWIKYRSIHAVRLLLRGRGCCLFAAPTPFGRLL